MSFYDNFVACCDEIEVTPTEVARATGITQQAVSLWKKRGSIPKAETLYKLANFFGVTVGYLLDGLTVDKQTAKKYEDILLPDEISIERTDLKKQPISLEESSHLLVRLGFIQEGEDLSDADLAFLENIIKQLDIWFSNRQRPQHHPQSTPAPPKGTDTTSTQDAPETPPEGE